MSLYMKGFFSDGAASLGWVDQTVSENPQSLCVKITGLILGRISLELALVDKWEIQKVNPQRKAVKKITTYVYVNFYFVFHCLGPEMCGKHFL